MIQYGPLWEVVEEVGGPRGVPVREAANDLLLLCWLLSVAIDK